MVSMCVVCVDASIEPYPSNMFQIYISSHCTAMGGVPGASMEVQCLALRGHLGLTETTPFMATGKAELEVAKRQDAS